MSGAIDRAKLARLNLDLDLRRAALRASGDLCNDARDQHDTMRAQLLRDLSRHAAGLWDEQRQSVADLLALSADDLRQCRVDIPLARQCIAALDRMNELRRRHDALAAELDPLSRLVANLNVYVLEH